VRDEEGRRRFHGAFTGGFSAGFYNTVGSKEGMLLEFLIIIILHLEKDSILALSLAKDQIYRKKINIYNMK